MTLPWTADIVQRMLYSPHWMLRSDPWRAWIIAQGGIQAVYRQFGELPLAERERKILALLLAEPGLTNIQYAAKLNMHRTTYQRSLRALTDRLAAHLLASNAAPPARAEAPVRAPIPRPLTPLIGRARELALASAWLRDPVTRLITIVGTGGIGKTRLAAEIAWANRDHFADGAAFIALTTMSDPAMVLPGIARALGVRDDEEGLQERLGEYLAHRHCCLVLDNAEHVLEAAAAWGRLLQQAPRLSLVVTSRVSLRMYGERLLEVPPLATPPLGRDPGFAALREAESVRLFASRAEYLAPDFRLTEASARAVHEVCARLDGLPLAIELAAAQLRYHSLDEIVERLDERFTLLANGPRDVEWRQRALIHTIDWSYDLLPPAAQTVFRWSSILVDGWDRPALLAVAGGSLAPAPLDDALQSLIDHHLVRRLEGDGPERRFGMFETIREYALGRLLASGEERERRALHLAHCEALAAPAETALIGGDQMAALDRLEAMYPNIRAALAWALARDPVAALRLAGSLWRFWTMRESHREGQSWLEAALEAALPLAPPPLVVAHALHGLGQCLSAVGAYGQALPAYERGLELAADDSWRRAWLLDGMGFAWSCVGSYQEAKAAFASALELRQAAGEPKTQGLTYLNLGTLVYRMGDRRQAIRYYEQSLLMFKAGQHLGGIGMALNNLGVAMRETGALAEAERLLAECLAVRKQLRNRSGILTTLINLTELAADTNEPAKAQDWLGEALAVHAELEDPAVLLPELAEVAAKTRLAAGDPADAARFWGAAQQIRRRCGTPANQGEHAWYAEFAARAVAALGSAAFELAVSAGAALDDIDIVAALRQAAPPP